MSFSFVVNPKKKWQLFTPFNLKKYSLITGIILDSGITQNRDRT